MSCITEIIMLAPSAEHMAQVNRWLAANKCPELVAIQNHAGGNKVFCAPVWAAAINYFNTEKFVAAVKQIYSDVDKYDRPTLLVKEEGYDSDEWTVYMSGRLRVETT